jgi:kynureninase
LRSSRLSLRPSECTFISYFERTADSETVRFHLAGQAAWARRRLDPDRDVRTGSSYTLREEDILDTITKHGSEIALVMFSRIQYWSDQLFPIESITKKGKEMV